MLDSSSIPLVFNSDCFEITDPVVNEEKGEMVFSDGGEGEGVVVELEALGEVHKRSSAGAYSGMIEVEKGMELEELDVEVTENSVPISVVLMVKEALEVAEELGVLVKDCGDMNLLKETFKEAFELFGSDLGIKEACESGKGFAFPMDEIEKDAKSLRVEFDGSLSKMAKGIFDGCYKSRFNEDKVKSLQVYDVNFQESYEDWNRLFDVAKNGVCIPLPIGFVPTSEPRKLRSTYLDVHEAVNKTLCKYREKKFCLILPNDVLKEVKEALHYNDMHWVTKVGAPEGRTIADLSACDIGKFALNCPEVKLAGIEFCGELRHPVVIDYVSMIVQAREFYAEQILAGEKLVMFKIDIKDAFMRFWLNWSSVPWCCFALTNSLTMIFLTGFFGWTSFPQYWGIVTRILVRVANVNGLKFLLGYVDDFSGCCLEKEVDAFILLFTKFVELLFGENSVAAKKTEFGRCVVHIGWSIDLDDGPLDRNGLPVGTIAMSRRNLLKMLHGFFSLPVDFRIDRNRIEKLASWMSRYSGVVFPQLRPFASILFREIAGLNRNVVKVLSLDAINAILVWRSFLCLFVLFPCDFTRPLSHLSPKSSVVAIEFDASLRGLGIRLFSFSEGVKHDCFCIICIPLLQEQFVFSKDNDPGYQNSVEFCAIVIGLFKLVQLGYKDIGVHLEGDSMSALCWSAFKSFRKGPSFLTACAQMLLALRCNVVVSEEFEHLSVVDNVEANYDCDWLSRSGLEEVRSRYPEDILSTVESDPWINRVLEVINPELSFRESDSLFTCWKDIDKIVEEIALLGKDSIRLPEVNSNSTMLQIFVSCKDQGLGTYTWRGPGSSTIADLLRFIEVTYADKSPPIQSFYAPRYKRFLASLNPETSLCEIFVDADVVIFKAVGLGGSLDASDRDPEMEVLHNETLKWTNQIQKLIAGSRFTKDSLSNKRAPLRLEEEGNVVAVRVADSFSEVFKKGKYLKDGDLDELKGISGIEEGTSENYKRDWHFWPDFLAARDQLGYLFLDDLDTLDRSGLVSLFIIWLRKRIRCSDSKITRILSGVRYAFVKAGVNVSCLEEPLVRLAKKTGRESARDISIRTLHSGDTKLPATFDFLLVLRAWKEEVELSPGERSKRQCSFLASIFCFNFATRFGNVGNDPTAKGKHAIRRKDVVFEDVSNRRFNIPDYVEFLISEGVWPDVNLILGRIVGIVIFIHSSKVRKKVGRVEVLGRRSPEESLFLEELASWILFDCNLGTNPTIENDHDLLYDGDALLFSRSYHNGRNFYYADLTRSNVADAIKLAATRLNLNKKAYSTHSWKKGGITNLVLNGQSDEVVRRFGDHAPDSASTFLYQHASGREARPLLYASRDEGLSVRDINLACPLTEISYESLSPKSVIVPLADIEDTPVGVSALVDNVCEYVSSCYESDGE